MGSRCHVRTETIQAAVKRKERVEYTRFVASKLGSRLPEHLREQFTAWMEADLEIEGMSETNRDVLRAAIRLAEACGCATADVTTVLDEIDHRRQTLGGLEEAIASVVDDLSAYPPRWPARRTDA